MKYFDNSWKIIFALSFLIVKVGNLSGQLDNRHWIPPMVVNTQLIDYHQYIYLSTPFVEPFTVTIKDGNGAIVIEVLISKSTPQEIYIPRTGEFAHIPLVHMNTLDKNIFDNRGLIIEGEKDFYVNYRVRSSIHAGSFVTKGEAASGVAFRTGHIFTSPVNGYRLHFISFIATHDNTFVTISDIPEGTELVQFDEPVTGPLSIELPKVGNSYVLGLRVRMGQENGFMGTLVTSNNPIVVNCGSWFSSPGNSNHNDIGIEQIISADKIGKEYILVRGNGPDILETPIVIAHYDESEIYINGDSIPFAVMDAGEFRLIPSNKYSSEDNMYINTSQPVYVYQSLGGNNEGEETDAATVSLSLVTPLSCTRTEEVYEIPLISMAGEAEYSVNLSIVNRTGAGVSINNGDFSIGNPSPVPGNPEFETYKISALSGDITIKSTKAIQIGVIGGQDYSSWSSYYSGFSLPEKGDINITRKNGCEDILNAESNLPGQIDWYLNNKLLYDVNGAQITATEEGEYKAVLTYQYGGCNQIRKDTSNAILVEARTNLIIDNIDICKATVIDAENDCKAKTMVTDIGNGSVDIYASGGSGNYTYYIDDKSPQLGNNSFTGLNEGQYTIRIKDSLGCEISQTIYIEAIQFQVKTYPNPVSENLFFTLEPSSMKLSTWEVLVFDIIGRKTYKEEHDGSPKEKHAINLGNLPSGTYIVQFNFENEMDECGRTLQESVCRKIVKIN